MAGMIEVDARGQQCPIPVVQTKKALEQLGGAGMVKTCVDNEIAVQNLMKMAKQKGLDCTSQKISEQHFEVYIKVGTEIAENAEEIREEQEETVSCYADCRGDYVVAVDSEFMGRGDEKLGKVLMKGFIYALSQLEELPKTVLFYNGGAKITTEASDSLEDLRAMEAQGVSIKTCGTCLNYYDLTEKLAVGEVTNMYEIVETLTLAKRVIKP